MKKTGMNDRIARGTGLLPISAEAGTGIKPLIHLASGLVAETPPWVMNWSTLKFC